MRSMAIEQLRAVSDAGGVSELRDERGIPRRLFMSEHPLSLPSS
jgi:hypothetical protein